MVPRVVNAIIFSRRARVELSSHIICLLFLFFSAFINNSLIFLPPFFFAIGNNLSRRQPVHLFQPVFFFNFVIYATYNTGKFEYWIYGTNSCSINLFLSKRGIRLPSISEPLGGK